MLRRLVAAEAVRREPGGDDHRQPVLGRDQAQLVGGQQFGFVDVVEDQQAAAVFAHFQLIFRRVAILEVAQLLVDRVTPGMGDSLELRQCALGLLVGGFSRSSSRLKPCFLSSFCCSSWRSASPRWASPAHLSSHTPPAA